MALRLYTVDEVCRILNKSRATIYNWINAGKLQSEDHPEGKMIYLDSDLESNDSNLESSQNLESNNLNQGKSRIDKDSISLKILDQLESMQSKLLEYAEQAGKVKLLTDNNKFYQDEYFRLKYELESLQNLYKNTEKEKSELTQKVEQLEAELKKPRFKLWGSK